MKPVALDPSRRTSARLDRPPASPRVLRAANRFRLFVMLLGAVCFLLVGREVRGVDLHAGDIIVATSHGLVRVDPATGVGTAIQGKNYPMGVLVDPLGTLYEADYYGSIWRVDPVAGASTFISNVGGTATNYPVDIVMDANGDLYASANDRIFRIDPVTGNKETILLGLGHAKSLLINTNGNITYTTGYPAVMQIDPTTGDEWYVGFGDSETYGLF